MKTFEINENYLKIKKDQINKIFNFDISYIFGMNGSGKTVLSRKLLKLKEKNIFVFNKDYILKNIYFNSIDNDDYSSIKLSDKNKENTFEIFLGERLVESNNKIRESINNINNIKKWFNAQYVTNPINDKYKWEFKFEDFFEEIEKIENFEKNIKSFLNELNDKEKKLKNLKNKKIYEKFYKDYNKVIELFLETKKEIEKYNEIKKIEKINIKFIKLHEYAKKCCVSGEVIFLDKKYKEIEIDQWIKKNKNEKFNILKNIEKNKKNINNNIINLCENYNIQEEEKIKKLKAFQKGIDFNIINEEKIIYKLEINEYEYLKFDFESEQNKIYEWFNNNKLNIILKDIWKEANQKLKSIKEEEKIKKTERNKIKKESQEIKNEFIKIINYYIEKLSGNNFGLKLKISNKGEKTFLELISDHKKIQYISEGEKSILALSYFFTDLELNYYKINSDYLIFIDDPFDSNDHFKYDNLPKIKIKSKYSLSKFCQYLQEEKNKKGNLVITTHNVNVLSAFLRNITNDNKNNSCFKEIDDDKNNNIGLFLLERNGDNSSIIELNKKLFFPIESKLRNNLYSIYDRFKNNWTENIDENELQIFILICILLTKLYDGICNKKRSEIKKYVNVFYKKEEDKKSKDSLTNIALSKEINFVFNEKEINSFIKKYSIVNKYNNNNNIVEYIFFIKDRYQKIINSNDVEKIKRMRHKNNFYSSPIGHIIEE